jgi:ribosomal protein S18 acetylase RimI-like enzyme
MPEIEIRPATEDDIPALVAIDHSYSSNYVWQVDLNQDEGQIEVNFREIRLPRKINVDYPRQSSLLINDWENRSGLLVSVLKNSVVGYISISENMSPTSAWVTDLVVAPSARRNGIASALILAAEDWARRRNDRRMILELQSKNTPAIRMALKLGFEFCGYNDHYYLNQDIALFFTQFLRSTM